jgi:hypothetical protein
VHEVSLFEIDVCGKVDADLYFVGVGYVDVRCCVCVLNT